MLHGLRRRAAAWERDVTEPGITPHRRVNIGEASIDADAADDLVEAGLADELLGV